MTATEADAADLTIPEVCIVIGVTASEKCTSHAAVCVQALHMPSIHEVEPIGCVHDRWKCKLRTGRIKTFSEIFS